MWIVSARIASGVSRDRPATATPAGGSAGWRSRMALGVLLAGAVALVGAGWPAAAAAPSPDEIGQLHGVVREAPNPVPDFTLPDTAGHPFRFAQEAAGHVTLLYFGYTHCPDICPVQMANLAAVLGDLPWDLRQRFKVVFVTTDPARDTPAVLRRWLDRFDPTFVGLSGTVAQVNAAQALLGLPPLVREGRGPGGYGVGHAAQVIAFTADGRTRVDYPAGTRQADWAHDLPLLAGPPSSEP
jgi:protein SCO1/2